MALFFIKSPRKRLKTVIRVFAIVMAFAGVYFAAIYIQKGDYELGLKYSLLVLFASILEFIISDFLSEKYYPARTRRLLDALELKVARVKDPLKHKLKETMEHLRGCDKSKVNAVVHLKVNVFSSIDDEIESALVQVTDYYGSSSRPPWRINSCYKGIIGRCLRTGEPEYVNFANVEEYKDRMVKEFGFTESEAKCRTNEARSYYAHPITRNSQLIGVLFLYSTDLQVFPNSIEKGKIDSISKDVAMLLETVGIA